MAQLEERDAPDNLLEFGPQLQPDTEYEVQKLEETFDHCGHIGWRYDGLPFISVVQGAGGGPQPIRPS